MSRFQWSALRARGIDPRKVEPAVRKLLGPPLTIAKPQFREAFLELIQGSVDRPVAAGETIELVLVADEIWESWPPDEDCLPVNQSS